MSDPIRTRTWLIVRYGGEAALDHRLYVALWPEHLERAYSLVRPMLDRERVDHRCCRDASLLEAYGDDPYWVGKAMIIDPPAGRWEAVAAQVDAALTGHGLSGPDALAGARPWGGHSGRVFTRVGETAPAEVRKTRLSHLLNT